MAKEYRVSQLLTHLQLYACACLQQWPAVSCDSLEELQEAAKLQQELQSRFELLNAILTRRAAAKPARQSQAWLPAAELDDSTVNKLSLQGIMGKRPSNESGKRCAGASHKQQSASTTHDEDVESSQHEFYQTGGIAQKSKGSHAKAGPKWLPCCGGARAHTTGSSTSDCAISSEALPATKQQRRQVAGGQEGRLSPGVISPLASAQSLHTRELTVPVTDRSSSPLATSFASTSSNPSEEPSSALDPDATNGSAARRSSHIGHQQDQRPCCFSRVCSVGRVRSHTEPNIPNEEHAGCLAEEGMIPVFDLTMGSAEVLEGKSPAAARALQSAEHLRIDADAVDVTTKSDVIHQRPVRAQRRRQHIPARALLGQQYYPSYSGGLRIQGAPFESFQQRLMPVHVTRFDHRLAQQEMDRKWPVYVQDWQQQWQEWLQQVPFQQRAVQQFICSQRMRERDSFSSVRMGLPAYCRTAQGPWVPMMAPTVQVWSPWVPFNVLQRAFAGQRDTPIPGINASFFREREPAFASLRGLHQ